MPGELSLTTLLRTLQSTLDPRVFVFITLTPLQQSVPLSIPFDDIQMSFREQEGITIVTTAEIAEQHKYDYIYRSRMITLNVHSSLEAVGFMKVISTKLAEAEVSSNVVAAYYHDHIFVEEMKAEMAMEVLEGIARQANSTEDDSNF